MLDERKKVNPKPRRGAHAATQKAPTTQKDMRAQEQQQAAEQLVNPHTDSPRIDNAAYEEPQEPELKRTTRIKNYAYKKTPQKFKNANDLQIRLRTGVVYILITLIGLLAGNIPCVVMLSLTVGICAGEFYFMLRSDAKLPNEAVGIVGACCYPPAMYIWGLGGATAVTLLLMIALLIWYVGYLRARIADVCISLFGAVYTGALLGSAMLIRPLLPEPWGGILLVAIFASVWANDGAAYLVGSRIGKHKMAPRVSPKKSWEGFFAGIIVSMGIWCLITLIPGVTMSIPQALLFGLLCGIMSIIGDLAESRIKRNSGFKDSGTIMPGHGGLLDRTDSMFLAAVTSAILLLGFGCLPIV